MLFIKNQTEEFMVLEKNNQDLNVELDDKTKKIYDYKESFRKIRNEVERRQKENENEIGNMRKLLEEKDNKISNMTKLLKVAQVELQNEESDKKELKIQKTLNIELSKELTNTKTELEKKNKYIQLVESFYKTLNDTEKEKVDKFIKKKLP
jgi:hypothetical protein